MINKQSIIGLVVSGAALITVPVGASALGHHASSQSSVKMTMSSKSHQRKAMAMSSSMMMSSGSSMAMDHMMSTNGGAAPKGLAKATHAKYPVGSKVMIKANHMDGMKGATATVVGAYQTELYTIDYQPTNGGAEVKNHRYVIAKEVQSMQKGRLKVGTKITVKADHMAGMQGATGKIVSVKKGPAYMVNFKATNGNTMYKNHKWLAQSDLMVMK